LPVNRRARHGAQVADGKTGEIRLTAPARGGMLRANSLNPAPDKPGSR
jgi:hypothetical protein